jgi:hypothetical protein
MLRKVAIALAIALPFFGVAATIGSLSNLKSEFVGLQPVQEKTSNGTAEEFERPLNKSSITNDDEEMRNERC